MAKKVTYIKGTGPDQTRLYPDGTKRTFSGVTTHYHIRKPHTKMGTLCGARIVKGVVATTDRPKPIKRKTRELSQVCSFCDRISKGLDPVFQHGLENKSHRDPDSIGTRAKPVQVGTWNRAEKVA